MRRLAAGDVERSPYAEIATSAIAGALDENPELHAIVADRAGEIVGAVIYGPVAGAVGTGKVHLIVVTAAARLQGVAKQLCDAAAEELVNDGVRLIVAELPDSPGLRAGRVLLERCGWREEGRVEDFFADGVGLLLLRRDT